MGSLILLLLVIDRRAKAVSRAKAAMSAAERLEDKAQQEKIKAEEWAEAQRKLHASLEEELHEVRGQADKMQRQIGTAATELTRQQSQSREAHERLDAEKDRYSLLVSAIAARKEDLAKTGKQDETTESMRRQMTADLMSLEQTLADLTALRKREQRTFSLVPYKGRRGEDRRPIYLECTATGWTFHPDMKSLAVSEEGVKNLRAELEHRLPASAGPKVSAPYLFLLVRPDGIANYYRAQAAMQGLPIDFGYEFVDASWILDFLPKSETTQPWMTASTGARGAASSPTGPAAPRRLTGPRLNGVTGSSPPARDADTQQGQGTTTGENGSFPTDGAPTASIGAGKVAKGSGSSRVGASDKRGAPNDGSPFAAPGTPSAGGPGDGPSIITGLPAGTDSLSPIGSGSHSGTPGSPSGLGTGGSSPSALPGCGDAPFPPATSGGGRDSSSPIATPEQGTGHSLPNAPLRRDGVAASPLSPSGKGVGGAAHSQDPTVIGRPPAPFGHDLAPPASQALPSVGGAGDASSGGSGNNGNASGGPNSQGAANGNFGHPDSAPASSPSSPPGSPHGNAASPSAMGTPGSATGAPGDEEPAAGLGTPSLSRLPSASDSKKAKPPPPPRASRFTSNRDWIVPLECTAEWVSLLGGAKVSARSLAEGDAGAQALLKAVQEVIDRKQATVRAGEPAYRPQVRFLVHPDGLRVYHLAYPALEGLNIPILRQNLAPEDPNEPNTGVRRP
jgi:hypothetical protein